MYFQAETSILQSIESNVDDQGRRRDEVQDLWEHWKKDEMTLQRILCVLEDLCEGHGHDYMRACTIRMRFRKRGGGARRGMGLDCLTGWIRDCLAVCGCAADRGCGTLMVLVGRCLWVHTVYVCQISMSKSRTTIREAVQLAVQEQVVGVRRQGGPMESAGNRWVDRHGFHDEVGFVFKERRQKGDN